MNWGLYSDLVDEVRISDNEVFELEVGNKVGSVNVSSVDERVKIVKGEVIGGVGIIVCWFVDGGVGDGNGSDDGIKFGFYDGYYLVYSNFSFDNFRVDKFIIRYLY